MHNLYIDNVITGCDTEDAAADYYKETPAIMSSGMFNLRRWSSNSSRLQANAVQDNTANVHSTVNVLGLRWDPSTNLLSLVAKPFLLTNSHLATNREVLQATSRIINPLGFISPVVVQAKIFIQTLWQHKVGWDEPLNDDLAKDWSEIANDLKQSSEFSVKRCYFPAPPTQSIIHCFADASQKAYGAIIFLVNRQQPSLICVRKNSCYTTETSHTATS